MIGLDSNQQMNTNQRVTMKNLILPKLSYKICGLLFKVHNSLGRYCNEKQYSDAFEHLLVGNNIRYEREKYIPISFEGEKQGRNKVDFIIDNGLIIEFKSKRILLKEDYYQVKRYLVAFNKQLGFLVNFRDKFLKPRRILNPQVRFQSTNKS